MPDTRRELAELLLAYVRARRWFRGKSRTIRSARIADVIPLNQPGLNAVPSALVLLEVSYNRGEPEPYAVPLTQVNDRALATLETTLPHAIIARRLGLVDGLATGHAADALMAIMRQRQTKPGEQGQLRGEPAALLDAIAAPALVVEVPQVEQTNSTLSFGGKVLLKIYRQPAAGPNPEVEMGQFLTSHARAGLAPRVLGALTYVAGDGANSSLAIAHEFLSNDGDAWSLALREVRGTLDRAGDEAPPETADDQMVGRFAGLAATLGRRTGELHLALADSKDDPDFAPMPLGGDDRAALAARVGRSLQETLALLATTSTTAAVDPDPAVAAAVKRLSSPGGRDKIAALLAGFRDQPLDVVKMRTHGDLHLGQVLSRGDDFAFIDFEGEPARALSQRRARASPLRDVMGMVRSFDYAPASVLRQTARGDSPRRHAWGRLWTRHVTQRYIRAYLDTVAGAPFIPGRPADLALMLSFYELEKVVYEVGYEANNRPDWLAIPMAGLLRIAGLQAEAEADQ
ncbi:MAG TPA: putative maltokinase [Polyangia bacterium]|nr:putative maltokinase [Polyangia bacterium]